MPTYVYKCDNCGEFETQQQINDDPYKVCPKCGGSKLRRMVTNTAGVIMKSSRQKNSSNAILPQCAECNKMNECRNISKNVR